MQEIFYVEVPTPDVDCVKLWLTDHFEPLVGTKVTTASGCMVKTQDQGEWSIFVWSALRTTYLKVFRWSEQASAKEKAFIAQLKQDLHRAFPPRFPEPP
ncbi:MAG TPA: flavin-dependent dehydrogenase, partial [Stenomitos sp.]